MTLARRSTVESDTSLLDTMQVAAGVMVHPTDIQDRDGAKLVIDKLTERLPRMKLVWADAGYAGKLIEWVWALTGWALEIVKRPRDSHELSGDAAKMGG